MKFGVRSAVYSHKGNLRENNEDNFFLNGIYMQLEEMDKGGIFTGESQAAHQLYAVCDGMGGEESGELASSAVVAALAKLDAGKPARDEIDRIVQAANEAVCALQRRSGSTLALLYLHEGAATVAWLGDSRIYLMRNGKVFRLSEDHTQSQRLINMGVLDEEAAKSHAMRHVVTRFLGMDMEDFPLQPAYGKELTLKRSDRFLLCSDGLTDMLDEGVYAKHLNASPEQAVNALVDGALAAGGRDNVTAMAVEIVECKRGRFA